MIRCWIGGRATLLIAALALSSIPRAVAADDVVALYPVRGLGVDPETVEGLEIAVHGALHRLPGTSLVPRSRAESFVEREGLDCDGEDACLADYASGLGASTAVYGAVGGLGESYSIALKAVDAERGAVRSRVELRVGEDRDTLVESVRAGAFELLRPDLYTGSLRVELSVDGAEVFVDGELVGTTPLPEPIQALEPGRRALKIVKTGYKDFDRFVDVRFQKTSVVTIDLEESAISDILYEGDSSFDDLAAGDELPIELASIPAEGGEKDSTEEDPAVKESAGDEPVDDTGVVELEPGVTEPSDEAVGEGGAGMSALRAGAYGLLAGGGAALAAGGFFGISARSQETNLSGDFEKTGPSAQHVDDWNRAQGTARRANLFYATGAAVTGAGAALLVVDIFRTRKDIADMPATASRPGVTIAPSVVASGPTVVLSVDW